MFEIVVMAERLEERISPFRAQPSIRDYDSKASSGATAARSFISRAARAMVPLPQQGSRILSDTMLRTHNLTRRRASAIGVGYCPRSFRFATSTVPSSIPES